jgi:hypothetical protein
LTLSANVESLKTVFLVPDLSPAKAILWEQSALLLDALFLTTCCSLLIKRRTKPNNKVSSFLDLQSITDPVIEAAIDANAPLEDEEAGNGPVDSDEELTAVMHGLSNWNPQPVVPPLVHEPIEKKYMRQRLYEQLHNATNGFTVNIFKVVGYGAQTLPAGHPGLQEHEGDADGEMDNAQGLGIGMNGVAARRASGFNMQLPPQRRPSGTAPR